MYEILVVVSKVRDIFILFAALIVLVNVYQWLVRDMLPVTTGLVKGTFLQEER